MKRYTDTTLKRAAAVREMTELGQTPMQIAVLLQCDPSLVYAAFWKFDIPWTRQATGPDPHIRMRILRDAHLGLTGVQMAERYGTTRQVIAVTLCKLRKAGKFPPLAYKARRASGKVTAEVEANP